jgi:hypothetical protein
MTIQALCFPFAISSSGGLSTGDRRHWSIACSGFLSTEALRGVMVVIRAFGGSVTFSGFFPYVSSNAIRFCHLVSIAGAADLTVEYFSSLTEPGKQFQESEASAMMLLRAGPVKGKRR